MTGAKTWSWPLRIKTENICSFSASQSTVYKRSSQALSTEQMVSHCAFSPSLCLPTSHPFCPPGQREGPHHSELVIKSTKSCCHLNISNISGYGKPWEGAVAVISHGSFTPHLSETMFFLFFWLLFVCLFCSNRPIQQQLFQVPGIGYRSATVSFLEF